MKLELKLANLEVVHSRVGSLPSREPLRWHRSRAFSSLEDFANWTRHLGGQETRWLAMKGVHPNEELAALPEDFGRSRARAGGTRLPRSAASADTAAHSRGEGKQG